MTAREVMDLIKQNLGIPWSDRGYRDTFKIGDPDTVVTGIATTMMSTFDVIKRAHAARLNFIISHENTFWTDREDTKTLVDIPLFKIKTDYCHQNGIVIHRFHDHQHSKVPDLSVVALLRMVGIEDQHTPMSAGVRTIPETTLGALAASIRKKTGIRAIRVAGDPDMKVTRIAMGPGYAFPRMTADVDVVIGGETAESDGAFDITSYVRDAAALGIPKGQITMGHMVSEEGGMKIMAEWMRDFITGVPIQFVPCGEPYWT